LLFAAKEKQVPDRLEHNNEKTKRLQKFRQKAFLQKRICRKKLLRVPLKLLGNREHFWRASTIGTRRIKMGRTTASKAAMNGLWTVICVALLSLISSINPAQAQTFTRTCTGDEAATARRVTDQQLTRFRRTDTMIFNNVPDGAVIAFSTRRVSGGRPSGLRYSSSGTQAFAPRSFTSGIIGIGASRSTTINVGDDGSTGVDNGSVRLNIAAVTNGTSTPAAIRQRWTAICTPPDIAIRSLETGSARDVADGGTDAHGSEPAATSKTVEYVITNTLGGTLTIDGPIVISGLSNVTSAVVSTPPSDTRLTAGETTSFFVTYTPTAAGPFSFDITVPNTDFAEGSYNIEASGTATGAAEIDISSSQGGAVADGGTDTQTGVTAGTPVTVTYTINNTGTDALSLPSTPTITGLSNITGTPVIGGFTPTTVAPGGSTTFTVTYTPATAGSFGFDIAVPNDDADEGPYNIAASGTATGGLAAPGDAEIEISSSQSGAVADGGTDTQGPQPAGVPVTTTYTVTNSGTDTLTLGGTPSLSNLVNVDDGITVTAPTALVLAPGESATFDVTYTPSDGGPFSFDLDVLSDDADEATYDIGVTGAGNARPTVVLTGPTTPQPGPFTVTATFSEAVTGVALSDFVVVGGVASGLVMVSPGVYTIVVTPDTPGGSVSVSLPENIAMDADAAMNEASNVLSVTGGALTEPERDEIRDVIVTQEIRHIRTQLAANQRSVRDARERHIAGQRCRALEETELENGQVANVELQAECRSDEVSRNSTPLGFDGSLQATKDSTNIVGAFFGQFGSFDGAQRRLVYGDFDLTRHEDGDVTASFDGRVAWERLVGDDMLLGYYVGANLSQTDIEGNFSGTHLGYGLSAGVYFVDQLDENLFWDGFVALGFGRNDLDLGNGLVDVGSDYNTTSVQIGFSVSGVKQYSGFEMRPELSVAYGYSDIGTVDLGVATASSSLGDIVTAGNVSLGTLSLTPEFVFPLDTMDEMFDESEFRVTPSLTCEYINAVTSGSDCGGGLELEWSASSYDGLREFSAKIGHEVVGQSTRNSFGLQFRSEF
jgi:hypothetical protein